MLHHSKLALGTMHPMRVYNADKKYFADLTRSEGDLYHVVPTLNELYSDCDAINFEF